MNVLHAIGHAFVGIGKGLLSALRFAQKNGLTDDLVDLGLHHFTNAPASFATDDERFNYAVSKIRGPYVPDAVARVAVSFAVQKYRAQMAHHG